MSAVLGGVYMSPLRCKFDFATGFFHTISELEFWLPPQIGSLGDAVFRSLHVATSVLVTTSLHQPPPLPQAANLVLNVDGCIGALFLDLLSSGRLVGHCLCGLVGHCLFPGPRVDKFLRALGTSPPLAPTPHPHKPNPQTAMPPPPTHPPTRPPICSGLLQPGRGPGSCGHWLP